MSNLPDQVSPLIRLSQGHLNLLECCPPKFQQVYLDGLTSLPEPEQQKSRQWGSRFHLLMQQRELTLPIDSLLTIDPDLDLAFKALVQANRDLQEQNSDIWREAEHCRTITSGSFLLTVIYDLLIAKTDRAIILDWKTYRQSRDSKNLVNNWQTRLYLYVLAETSEYSPAQIQMVYWFVKSGKPQSVTLDYSEQQHQQTEQDLADLLNELKTWLSDYRQLGSKLPHRVNCEQKCPYRQFLSAESAEKNCHQDWSKSICEIEEISI